MKSNILEINLDAVKETIYEELIALYLDEAFIIRQKENLYTQGQLVVVKAKEVALKELLIKLKERGVNKMSEKTIKRQVKGYLVSFRLVNAPVTEVKSMFLAHYSRKEVADLFNRYASAKKFALAFVVFKKIKKTTMNAHWHTDEYVQREEAQVRLLEGKDLN